MKKNILLVSLLTTFLLLMIPNVTAVEYKTIVDVNKSFLMNELQNNILIMEKPENIKEIVRIIHNLDKDELKYRILSELNNLDITDQQKILIQDLLNSDLFLQILLKGIVIPILLLITIGQIFPFWTGFFTGMLFLMPVSENVAEETGIPKHIIYFSLVFIDEILASIILSTIPSTGE